MENNQSNSELLEKLLKKTRSLKEPSFEKDVLENKRKHLENSRIEQEIRLKERQFKQELLFKENIFRWVIKTFSIYLVAVFLLIVAATLVLPALNIEARLSDDVLKTLLISTALAMVGLPTLIIKYLFPAKDHTTNT